MKKNTLILAMLLMAAAAFAQTSRRPANNTKPAAEKQEIKRTANTNQTANRTSENKNLNVTTVKRSNENNKGDNNARVTTTRTATDINSGRGENERKNVNAEQYNRENIKSEVNRNYESRDVYNHGNKSNETPRVNRNASTYTTYYESPRVYREHHAVKHVYHNPPASVNYRAKYYPYRNPVHINIMWTPAMRAEYFEIYPMVRYWRYPIGYHIESISAYEADFYRGEVMNVYGKVEEVFYTGRTDEYILYFGEYYPYQDFSVVIPGEIARRFSRWPEIYFEKQHIIVTGLITMFEDKPEIVIKRRGQISLY